MKPPEKADAVLQAMAPVNEEVAQENDFDRLEPPGLRSDAVAKFFGNDPAQPAVELNKQPENNSAPEQILAEKETEICEPGWTEETLSGFGRKDHLQGTKYQEEENKTKSGCGECDHVHGFGPGYRVSGNLVPVGHWRRAERPVPWAKGKWRFLMAQSFPLAGISNRS